MTWRDRAACADSDPELFFSDNDALVLAALDICGQCTVVEDCLQDAIDYSDTYGVRGGIWFDAKGKPQPPPNPKAPKRQPRTSVKCGTPSGYVTHRKNGEDPCDPCAYANAQYSKAWRAKRREAAA